MFKLYFEQFILELHLTSSSSVLSVLFPISDRSNSSNSSNSSSDKKKKYILKLTQKKLYLFNHKWREVNIDQLVGSDISEPIEKISKAYAISLGYNPFRFKTNNGQKKLLETMVYDLLSTREINWLERSDKYFVFDNYLKRSCNDLCTYIPSFPSFPNITESPEKENSWIVRDSFKFTFREGEKYTNYLFVWKRPQQQSCNCIRKVSLIDSSSKQSFSSSKKHKIEEKIEEMEKEDINSDEIDSEEIDSEKTEEMEESNQDSKEEIIPSSLTDYIENNLEEKKIKEEKENEPIIEFDHCNDPNFVVPDFRQYYPELFPEFQVNQIMDNASETEEDDFLYQELLMDELDQDLMDLNLKPEESIHEEDKFLHKISKMVLTN